MTANMQHGVPLRPIPDAARSPHLPDRLIIRKKRRRLSNGRVVEFVLRIRTGHDPKVTLTAELLKSPETNCNCAPLDIEDLYACCNRKCMATVCERHIRTCQLCGINFCTACITAIAIHGFVAVVCRACAKDLKRSKLVRALLKLFKKKKDATWLRTTE